MDLATLWEVLVFSAWWITANIMVIIYFKKRVEKCLIKRK